MVGLNSKNTSDGVQMALLSSRMESIARKMQNTLFRTARSGVLNTAHDFSCVILTADCQLLASAESLPIHVMIGPDLICKTIKKYHPDLKRGDAFLHNSPYEGNSHAADHCMVVPIFDDNDKHRFFVLAKAHQGRRTEAVLSVVVDRCVVLAKQSPRRPGEGKIALDCADHAGGALV